MTNSKMQLVDWLDDLCVRFIINLPQEELESVERICFQVEEAQWFYEDFVRPLDPSLPSMPLRTFCLQMFRHCPLLASFSEENHLLAFEEFLAYKTRVPVRGAILLNHAMDQALLVRGWKKNANWSFPRGKINKDERDLDCAVREVYEETGYDVRSAGLIHDESKVKYIEVTMREQHMKLYVFRDVPQDTVFQPRTRKEISKIQWYPLSQLPGYHKSKQRHNNSHSHDEPDSIKANKFYMVAPFLQPLKKWIYYQRKAEDRHLRAASYSDANNTTDAHEHEGYFTEDNTAMQQQFEQARQKHRQEATHQSNLSAEVFPEEGLQASLPTLPPDLDAAAGLKRLLNVDDTSQKSPQGETQNPVDLLAMLQGNSSTRQTNQPFARSTDRTQGPPSSSQQIAQMSVPTYFTDSQPLPQTQPSQQTPQSTSITSPSAMNGFFAPVQARRASRQNSMHAQTQTTLQQFIGYQSQQSTQQAPAPYQRTGDPQFARDATNSAQQGPSIPPAADLPAPTLSNHAMNLLNAFKSGASFETSKPAAQEQASSQAIQDPTHLANRLPAEQLISKPRLGHQHNESRSRQALTQTMPQPSAVEQPNANVDAPATVAAKAAQSDNQKNALLELFRRPSGPSSPVEMGASGPRTSLADLLQSPTGLQMEPRIRVSPQSPPNISTQQPASLSADPVELSAVPSPGFRSQKKQLFDHRDGMMKEHNPQTRVLNRSSASNRSSRDLQLSPNVSATVTGPLHTPEFGASRRKPRSSKQREENVMNVNRDQRPVNQSPIQILKRPSTPKDATTTTTKQSESPAKSPQPKRPVTPSDPADYALPSGQKPMSQSTPFQPQILRRPPQSPRLVEESSSAKPISPPSPEDSLGTFSKPEQDAHSNVISPPASNWAREGSTTKDQKQALLSLFSNSKSPVPLSSPKPDARTTLVSPLTSSSPIAEDSVKSSFVATKAASPSADMPSLGPLLTQMSTTNVDDQGFRAKNAENGRAANNDNGPSEDAVSKDNQSSMSADDRGFLLNYLQGFAQGRGR